MPSADVIASVRRGPSGALCRSQRLLARHTASGSQKRGHAGARAHRQRRNRPRRLRFRGATWTPETGWQYARGCDGDPHRRS